jgi:uncharacterized protein (TIGR00255 family)
MIQSMTGYGRSEGTHREFAIVAELRSTNHKYCDISVRLPKFLLPLEIPLKKLLQQRFTRGRLELAVSVNGAAEQTKRMEANLELARQYLTLMKEIQAKLDLPGRPDLGMLMEFRDIIAPADLEDTTGELESRVEALVGDAMGRLESMRKKEGQSLAKDLLHRIGMIEKALGRIQIRIPAMLREYQARLKDRIDRLTKGVKLDPGRLIQEVALFAERSDVTEELTRLKSHMKQFRTMIRGNVSVGRSLDFLIQEMNREVNTIGSKASDAAVALGVVGIKSELEKLREQVQNIE